VCSPRRGSTATWTSADDTDRHFLPAAEPGAPCLDSETWEIPPRLLAPATCQR
jgi:hypothetical protein